MPKVRKGKKGGPALVRRSTRNVQPPARLAGDMDEVCPTDDESSELHELRAQNEALRQQLQQSRASSVASEPAASSSGPALVLDAPLLPAQIVAMSPAAYVQPQAPAPTPQDLMSDVLRQMTASQATALGENHPISPFLVLARRHRRPQGQIKDL